MTADTPRRAVPFPPAAPLIHDELAADAGPLPADVDADAFTAPAPAPAGRGYLAAVRAVPPRELTQEYPQELPAGRGHAGEAFPIGLARRHPRIGAVCGMLHPEGIYCRREAGHPGEHCGWAFGQIEVSVWNTPEPPAPDWTPEDFDRPQG